MTGPPHRRGGRAGRLLAPAVVVVAVLAGCGGGQSVPDGFCDRAAELRDAGPVFPEPSASDPPVDRDVLALLAALRDVAPESVAVDLEVLLDALDEITAALDGGLGRSGDPLPYDLAAVDRARVRVALTLEEACDVVVG